MKPCNFPERKNQRRLRALRLLNAVDSSAIHRQRDLDNTTLALVSGARDKRSKKDRTHRAKLRQGI